MEISWPHKHRTEESWLSLKPQEGQTQGIQSSLYLYKKLNIIV